jgi:hypothetical protein
MFMLLRLLAIMGGILEMDGEQLVEEFARVCRTAFAKDIPSDRKAHLLEDQVKRIVKDYSMDSGGEGRMMVSDDGRCRVYVDTRIQNLSS